MPFDAQTDPDGPDKSRTLAAGQTGEGCCCPYCGRTIPSEELEAQGYAQSDAGSNQDPSEPCGNDLSADRGLPRSQDIDDSGIISRFNATRPAPLRADAERAAGLLSAARRMAGK